MSPIYYIDVRCQESDVKCQMSGVKCQMSDVRSQVSGYICVNIRYEDLFVNAMKATLYVCLRGQGSSEVTEMSVSKPAITNSNSVNSS